MLGPLGLLSPHPGVSYLFAGADAAPVGDGDGLWGVALGSSVPGPGGPLASPPPSWTPALGEMMLKVDGKFKVRFPFPPCSARAPHAGSPSPPHR